MKVQLETEKVEKVLLAVGNEWRSPDGTKHRIYFDPAVRLRMGGLQVWHYKTGNVQSARLDGERISNSQAAELEGEILDGKFWWDFSDHRFHRRNYGPEKNLGECPEFIRRLLPKPQAAEPVAEMAVGQ